MIMMTLTFIEELDLKGINKVREGDEAIQGIINQYNPAIQTLTHTTVHSM